MARFTDLASVHPMTGYQATDERGSSIPRDSLVEFLSWCVTGTRAPINLSPDMPWLDALLARDFVSGLEPILDDTNHIRVVAIEGFPGATMPHMLSWLDQMPASYRWTTRFIYLDPQQARRELARYRRQWEQQRRGFVDQLINTGADASGRVNQDAMAMVQDTDAAIAAAASLEVSFGWYTSSLVIHDTNPERAGHTASLLKTTLDNYGFPARVETVNTAQAYFGSLPGHSYENIRRPLLTTANLADLIPMSSSWAGLPYNPCDMYPPGSPPLLYADTAGATPFRLNLHVEDVGHTLVIGPTGTGKSTLLAMMAAQFRRYPGARVFAFDLGYSLFTLVSACGGAHYEIAAEDADLVFCPLQSSSPDWAHGWVRSLCELQLGRQIEPRQNILLQEAVKHLAVTEDKSLTSLQAQVQDETLRDSLTHYMVGGMAGHLLDGQNDSLEMSDFTCFELSRLWDYSDLERLPVLSYLFHRVESQLTGSPALILLDEAWVVMGHELFRNKLVEWLKTLRKQNCSVVLATQSLSDAAASGILDVILENTATQIYLPNSDALSEASRPFYEKVGLGLPQIRQISEATPKREYYAVSRDGSRMFNLMLGPTALAYVAQGGTGTRKLVKSFQDEHGSEWSRKWLDYQNQTVQAS